MLKKFTLISLIFTIILGIASIIMGIIALKEIYFNVVSEYEQLGVMQVIHESYIPENGAITIKGNAVRDIKFTVSPDNQLRIITNELGFFNRITKVKTDENGIDTSVNLSIQPMNLRMFPSVEQASKQIMQSLFGRMISDVEIQIPAFAILLINEYDYGKSNLESNVYSSNLPVYIDPSIKIQVISNSIGA
ncbi:MAG: hypothetical protein RSB96_01315 [Oscillospiraceae bacterium]